MHDPIQRFFLGVAIQHSEKIEMQKIGIPTGPMPDGSPNLTVLSVYSSIKGQSSEMLNSKIQVAIPPLTMTPAGFTVPAAGFGVSS